MSVQPLPIPALRRPLLAGDRINGSGSRLVRRLLLAGDDAGILRVAREQIAAGAQALNVCAAISGVTGEAERLERLVALLARATAVPLLIDSADPDALIAGLRACPLSAIVNSVNLIDRRTSLDRVLPVAVERGDGVIAQTIDEQGVPATVDGRLHLAKRLVEILTRDYGLAPESVWIDPVLMPIARVPDSAAQALAVIRRIRVELPGVRTALAVSNLSFGLTPRQRPALSSVFVDHAARAGLDVAIADPAQLRPYARVAARERQAAEAVLLPAAGRYA